MEKKDSFGIKKSNLVYAILILFLLLGLYLRIYHLNYPSIGYHNMKENEYLDEAYFFLKEMKIHWVSIITRTEDDEIEPSKNVQLNQKH